MEIKPSTHPAPESEIDALTVEIRIMLRLIEREDARKKRLVEAKAAKEKASPQDKAARKKNRAAAIKLLESSTFEPITRPCNKCKSLVHVKPGEDLMTTLCKRCGNRNRSFSLGIKPSSKPEFTSVHIVAGGAPGLGKR